MLRRLSNLYFASQPARLTMFISQLVMKLLSGEGHISSLSRVTLCAARVREGAGVGR